MRTSPHRLPPRARTRPARILVLACAAAIYAGCDPLFGPDGEWALGIGQLYDLEPSDPPPFVVPDTVVAGTPFVVEIRTMGGGCTRAGITRVEDRLDGPLVTPFDYRLMHSSRVCTAQLDVYVHGAELQFDRTGGHQVTFQYHGRGPTGSVLTTTTFDVHAR